MAADRFVKSFFRRHFPTVIAGLRVIASGRFEVFPPRVVHADRTLHSKIKALFGSRSGVFVEAGANDGLEYSNTAYLEKHCGWTGILVEAVPHKYVECVHNRPDADVVHAALTPSSYGAPFVELTYSNLMSVTPLSEISINEHAAAGFRFLGADADLAGKKFLAPARTMDSILAERDYPQIDFFSLDVEGAELQVLKGIDFKRTRPAYFLIEVRNLAAIGAFMAEQGYRMVEQWSHYDYLFVDEQISPRSAVGR